MPSRTLLLLIFLVTFHALVLPGEGTAQFSDLRFERITVDDGLPHEIVTTIAQDLQGFLWFGTWNGLARYDGYTFKTFRHDPDKATSISGNEAEFLLADRAGTLWIGTRYSGLNSYDPVSETFTHFRHDEGDANSLSSDAITALYEDQAGRFWVGTARGSINLLDRETGAVTRYEHDPSDRNNFGSTAAWSMMTARDGTQWISHATLGGVSRTIHGLRRTIKHPDDVNSYWGIRAIHEDVRGVLWFGVNMGLGRLDRDTGSYRRYEPHVDKANTSRRVHAIVEDRRGDLWVATKGGLKRFDRRTETFTGFAHDPRDPGSLSHNEVWTIYEDRRGELWVGTEGGLDRMDRTSGQFAHYPSLSGIEASSPAIISVLFEDVRGIFWVGTWGSGLARFDRDAQVFKGATLEGTNITTIYEDRAGQLWVGTAKKGMHLLSPEGTVVRSYTRVDGLPSDFVAGIEEDDSGTLWLHTDRGIVQFEPTSNRIDVFEINSGLPQLLTDESAKPAYASLKRSDGETLFGGRSGFHAFYPFEMEKSPLPPEVLLTGFKVFNEQVQPGEEGPLQQPISMTEAIELPYDQNDFTFDYVGLHYKNPSENAYAYMMENYDEAWVEAGTQRTARYSKLPPGTYTFRVKAANSDGIWNEEGASVRVVILPPWWRTMWAYFVYGLLFLAGVFAVDRFQRRRLIAREREKARERELEQAREIERAYHELRETKDRLVQQEKMASLGQLTAGIAHEIKNPLNFVNNFAEVNEELAGELREAAASGEDFSDLLDDLEQNARVINQHGKRADGIVQAMMQHASGGSGKRERVDLNQLVSEHIDLAYHGKRAQAPDLRVEINRDLGEDAGTVEVIPQEIGRVLLNLLGNAFDAVQGTADPKVIVRTRRVNGQVEIRVSDNGPGISAEIQEKIFEPFFTTKPTGSGTGLGLSLSYDIITQGHGGTLTVERETGEGATFVITLPG